MEGDFLGRPESQTATAITGADHLAVLGSHVSMAAQHAAVGRRQLPASLGMRHVPELLGLRF